MEPLLEVWPSKAKEITSPHEVRLTLLDTNVYINIYTNTKTYIRKLLLKNICKKVPQARKELCK